MRCTNLLTYDDVTGDPVQSPGGPSEPVGLTAPIVSLDFLTLSWRQPENAGVSDILGYTIQWNEADSVRYDGYSVDAVF